MVKSKGWNWEIVKDDFADIWKTPSIESFYLVNRWLSQDKKEFLDLGCGLGRHTILFAKNNFHTYAFDISEEAIERTKEWAISLNLEVNYKLGDMLSLPYKDEQFDCILCRNVISHTDTFGIKKIIKELYRVLKKEGECYLTLCSKQTWGFKQEKFPLIDPNTKIKTDEGPEKDIPHFYADYDLIYELFKNFKIELVYQVEDFYEEKGKIFSSWHYHILIRKHSY